jgi:hypothetical protein
MQHNYVLIRVHKTFKRRVFFLKKMQTNIITCQIKENEIGETCSMQGVTKNEYKAVARRCII